MSKPSQWELFRNPHWNHLGPAASVLAPLTESKPLIRQGQYSINIVGRTVSCQFCRSPVETGALSSNWLGDAVDGANKQGTPYQMNLWDMTEKISHSTWKY